MIDSDKLCLQWNEFQTIVSSAFGDLREDKDFTDVTLACEDGKQVEVHKVVLASSSPFFMQLLKRNKHPHPLIYMKGLKSENLMSMLEFFYFGEANVYQENLDTFLAFADELKLKGLNGPDHSKDADVRAPSIQSSEVVQVSESSKCSSQPFEMQKMNSKILPKFFEGTLVLNNSNSLQQLEDQINAMITKSQNNAPKKNGVSQGKYSVCKVCKKEGLRTAIKQHVEATHINGDRQWYGFTCDLCGKSTKTRSSLKLHKSIHHQKYVDI